MKAVLHQLAPHAPVIDLLHEAPSCDPKRAAYLFAALSSAFAPGAVFVGVVDPGVGGARDGVVLRCGGRWYVGPDNGLFDIVARRAETQTWWRITWQPPTLSASFHGRDLFAPIAARLANGAPPPGVAMAPPSAARHWPDDLAEIIYIDHFGNAMTGLRASVLPHDAVLRVGGSAFRHARTFTDVPIGAAFWYENANGLAELAINQGRAGTIEGVTIGAQVLSAT